MVKDMSKYILIPDSFKGTMSSEIICNIMEEAIRKFEPEADIVKIPVADGGEGSVHAFLTALGGCVHIVMVKGPAGKMVSSFWGELDDGTAIVEMAAAAGLPLMRDALDPCGASTYGVGQLVNKVLNAGCKKLIMGLGGSATTDGGCGMAAALGVRFEDKKGNVFLPTGGTLHKIASVDMTGLDPRLKDVEIVAMCDIDNPLYGPEGAAYVFGPQKGADSVTVEVLDQGLRHLAKVMATGDEYAPGSGAAGGLGYGMRAFLGDQLQMGIKTLLDTVHFDEVVKGARMVFSGEGKIDSQSIRGKVVIGVARRTKAAGVPLIAVVGDIGDNIEEAYDKGVSAIFSINRVAVPYKEAKLRAENDLRLTMENIMRFMAVK